MPRIPQFPYPKSSQKYSVPQPPLQSRATSSNNAPPLYPAQSTKSLNGAPKPPITQVNPTAKSNSAAIDSSKPDSFLPLYTLKLIQMILQQIAKQGGRNADNEISQTTQRLSQSLNLISVWLHQELGLIMPVPDRYLDLMEHNRR
jgi:hypothetical protein